MKKKAIERTTRTMTKKGVTKQIAIKFPKMAATKAVKRNKKVRNARRMRMREQERMQTNNVL
jgi:hypothetical protein